MTEVIQDTLRGVLKLNTFVERECFESLQDFLTRLPELLAVEVPQSVSGVLVSSTEPTEDDRDKLWVRRDNSGSFVGLYTFNKGKWRQFYDSATGEIHWIVGDSEFPPDGFKVLDDGDEIVPSYVVSALKGQYIRKDGDVNSYVYYAVRFDSF